MKKGLIVAAIGSVALLGGLVTVEAVSLSSTENIVANQAASEDYGLTINGSNFTITQEAESSNGYAATATTGGNAIQFGYWPGVSLSDGNIVFSNAANSNGTYLGSELFSISAITGMKNLSITIEAGTEEAPRPTMFGVYYGYGGLYYEISDSDRNINASEFFTLEAVGAQQTIDLNFNIDALPTHFSIFTLGGTTANQMTVSSIDIGYTCVSDAEVYSNLNVANETELRAALEYYAFGAGATNGGTITLSDDINLKTVLTINKSNVTINGSSKTISIAQGFIDDAVNFRAGTLNISDLTIDCTNLNGHCLFANGGATMNLTNVTINNFSATQQLHPINFYGSGSGTVTNVTVKGDWGTEASSHPEWCDVWVGDSRNVTIDGGDIGTVCVNASEDGGTLSAGNVNLTNAPTIGTLNLIWCSNAEHEYGEHAIGTVYMKATYSGTAASTTVIKENPDEISVEGLTEVKNSFVNA